MFAWNGSPSVGPLPVPNGAEPGRCEGEGHTPLSPRNRVAFWASVVLGLVALSLWLDWAGMSYGLGVRVGPRLISMALFPEIAGTFAMAAFLRACGWKWLPALLMVALAFGILILELAIPGLGRWAWTSLFG